MIILYFVNKFFRVSALCLPLFDQMIEVFGLQPGVRGVVLVYGHQPQGDRA